MITIFPKEYKERWITIKKDELLYSLMARYTFIDGNIKSLYDKEDLFGNLIYIDKII